MVAALLTGTAAQVSQVTGAVQTTVATRAAAATTAATRIGVYVPLTLAAAKHTARRVSTQHATILAAIVPRIVLTTAAVALRIPGVLSGVCRHCEP